MSFLSNVQSKVAHSSKIGLGKGELAQLQELIASEKAVLSNSHRLSLDTSKAASALREWGCGDAQGDDLFDVLGKVAYLFEQLSSAERRYSEHLATYRIAFKTLRTREESFIDLRKRKDQLAGKIEAAERQLHKTGPEHKERQTRIQRVEDLHQEMASLEHAVTNEEARLGDFKRSTVREALSLKLGAMLELAEKTSIVAEMCKLLVAEVPRETTQPGQPRSQYTGTSQTTEVIEEANKCLHAVVFNAAAGDGLLSGAQADGFDPDSSYDNGGAGLYPPPDQGTPSSSRIQYATDPSAQDSPYQQPSRNEGLPGSKRGRMPPFRTASNSSFGPRAPAGQSANEYGQQPLASHDYAADERHGDVAPAVHPGRVEDEMAQHHEPAPPPTATYGYGGNDRQSFPASVHPDGNNRSSLAYMGMEESTSMPEIAPPQPSYAAAPPREPTPPVAPRQMPPREQRDPSRNPDAQYEYEEGAHWVRNHATAPQAPVEAEQRSTNSRQRSSRNYAVPPPPAAVERTVSQTPSAKTPPQSPRPPNVRGDSALGSRHGFDAPVYGASNQQPVIPPPSPSRYVAGPPPPSGYSYHRANESLGGNGGGRITAGNFRRGASGPATPTSPAPSASAQIREAYLARAYNAVPPPQADTPPLTMPGSMPVDADQAPTPQSTMPLRLGRKSAEGQAVDLTQEPRNMRTGAAQSGHPDQRSIAIDGWAAPPSYSKEEGPGFGGNRFVTKLD